MRGRLLCSMVVGFLLYQLFCMWCFPDSLKEAPLQEYDGKTVTCAGTVSRREETTDYHIYYLEKIQNASFQKLLSNQNLLIYVKKEANVLIRVGNEILITGKMRLFESATNPGMFDQKDYYEKQGIAAMLWAESKNVKILDSHADIVRESLTRLRLDWQKQLIRILGEKQGQFLSAMLLGDKRDLDPELKEAYQLSGIGHILAVSGLHMSFLGNGVYQMLRKRGVPFGIAGTVGILLLTVYALMIGATVSSIRALVMYIVRMGAEITGRTYDQATSLAIAAFVIVANEPLYLTDSGFLLSFGAIMGILLLEPIFKEIWPYSKNPVSQEFRKNLFASISIQFMLLPVLFYFYYEVPTYSILLNLFVIPLMSSVIILGLAGSFFIIWFELFGKCLLQIAGLILNLYEVTAEMSLKLPFSRIILGQPKVWQVLTYYFLLFAMCFMIRCQSKKYKMFFSLMFACFSVSLLFFDHGTNGKLEVTMLDVGQGDGIVIRAPNGKTCMIDGGSTDISEVGKYRIEPFLKSQGISCLDYVFVSHGDEDHYSGILEMLQRKENGLKIKKLVLPVQKYWDEKIYELANAAKQRNVPVFEIEPGDKLKLGDLMIRCMQPGKEDEIEPGNAASMVLELAFGEFDMLFTGDVEMAGEDLLNEKIGGKQYEVLKAAHHGSRNSSNIVFLENIKPKVTLISAGKNNRYGHPHQETLDRFEFVGSHIFNTQNSGAVTIYVNDKKMVVDEFLE